MQDYNTIIGEIQMRQNNCSYSVIEGRYHIGSGTTQRILKRFEATGMTLEELRAMEPTAVEEMFYPRENLQRKDVPMPDFQHYYDRIHAKGSKVNISYCWIEYKKAYPDGYEQSQFYEYYNRFVKKTYGKPDAKSRKKSRKSIRQAIRRQLGYLKHDLAIIDQIAERHPDYVAYLPNWLKDRLPVIRLLYSQQQEMYSANTHRIENKIVSLSQPWI